MGDKVPLNRFDRPLSLMVLCAGLFIVSVVFAVRAVYSPGVYYSLAVVQVTVICFAAWRVGASAVRAEAEERRRLAVTGALLIMPVVLFSLLPGFATPWAATAAENRLRYLVLVIGAIAVAGGLVVLREALSEAGERFYSILGFAAIMLAGPLYLIWASIPLEAYSAKVRASDVQVPPGIASLRDLSNILLFFAEVLTYVATAAFAASLGRVQWFGRWATRAFVATSFFAVLCLVIRGVEFPDPTAVFQHGYNIPGFVFGIPAVPWGMPVMFGVILLWRAGAQQRRGS